MPRSSKLDEFAAIAQLARIFEGGKQHGTRRKAGGIELGIGDDAAVLRHSGRLVWTVDTAVEHVHFERAWLTLADLGWRSFNAAASDLCAMAGRPVCALSSVIFPPHFSARDLAQLARGQRDAARALRCTIVGGNLSRGAELSVTTTLIGSAARTLLRSGAQPGDELWLCGQVGLAAAGLRLLQSKRKNATRAGQNALKAFRRPNAELAFGLALTRRAHAAIDISDGLAGDAAHLARASGVCLVIDASQLEASLNPALHALAPELGVSALDLALYGGEDYALLAAGPARARPKGAHVIGAVENGAGVWVALRTARADARAGSGRESRASGGEEKRVRAGRGFEHTSGREASRVRR
jgi:thiamine-monophosphate kinase